MKAMGIDKVAIKLHVVVYMLSLRPHASLADAREQSDLLRSYPILSLTGGYPPRAVHSVTCTMSGIGRRSPGCPSLTSL